jgi:hypothetical protein
MLKYIIEYILVLNNSHHLTLKQANMLMGKIRDTIYAKHSGSLDDEDHKAN